MEGDTIGRMVVSGAVNSVLPTCNHIDYPLIRYAMLQHDPGRMLVAVPCMSHFQRSMSPQLHAWACVQVKQEKLKHMDAGKKEAANAARTAFGADYEARLRAEAGAQPDKLSRRKHQISSLFHQAKMKVRECFAQACQQIWTMLKERKLGFELEGEICAVLGKRSTVLHSTARSGQC